MAERRTQRRLAAIIAADVVAYSRLMRADEVGTLAQLKALRTELLDRKITDYSGRIVDTAGDGFLIEFPSAVDAVQHAVDVQQAIAQRNATVPEDRRMEMRIGINVGDVIVDGNDLFGDGVNVAARLEGLAQPGGICISASVYEQVRDKMQTVFEDLGEQHVKNIDRPVQAYRVNLGSGASIESNASQRDTKPPSAPEKPSIAVLPFDNMSGDPEQEYFSDGITEDIITELSRFRQFHVTARNTTFTLKNKTVDVPAIARDLGVQYVLEGSVRKSGNRVRVTAQLIDGRTGNHLWADRYDGDLEDIFAIQDEVTEKITGVIKPEIERAEIERVRSTKPEDYGAWEYYYRGISHFYRMNPHDMAEALSFFRKAIERDDTLSVAYSGLAEALSYTAVFEAPTDLDQPFDQKPYFDEAEEAGRKAISLDEKDPFARCSLGKAYLFSRRPLLAMPEYKAAIELNPALPLAHQCLGSSFVMAGRADEAFPHLERAIELSPHDLWLGSFFGRLAEAYLFTNQYEKAERYARDAIRQPSAQYVWTSHVKLISALGHLQKHEEAKQAVQNLLAFMPGITCRFVRRYDHMAAEKYVSDFIEGLRLAGLPE